LKENEQILIIGDGISSWVLSYYLAKKISQITIVSSDTAYSPCSLHSTSINCLRGTEQGISTLGDLICKSFEAFQKFNLEHSPDGVFEGIEYQIFNDLKKWETRYPDYQHVENHSLLNSHLNNFQFFYPSEAYFISPKKLKKWFFEQTPNAVREVGEVKKITKLSDSFSVNIDDSERIFDKVFICSNYQATKLAFGFNETLDYYLSHSKPVLGSYFEIDANEINFSHPHSLNMALDKHHFIYRKEDNIIQIGSTSINNTIDRSISEIELIKIFKEVSANISFKLPLIEKFSAKTGMRHKGYKRLPFWGEIIPGMYGMFGLYKNAYTFAFLGAIEILNQLDKND